MPRSVRESGDKKRARSGITGDTLLSNQLCSFLGLPAGSKMPRTEVTKKITAYIKEHNLQKENKRFFNPDSKLSSLLTPLQGNDVADGYNYFNLQRYMKHHYTSLKQLDASNVVSSTA